MKHRTPVWTTIRMPPFVPGGWGWGVEGLQQRVPCKRGTQNTNRFTYQQMTTDDTADVPGEKKRGTASVPFGPQSLRGGPSLLSDQLNEMGSSLVARHSARPNTAPGPTLACPATLSTPGCSAVGRSGSGTTAGVLCHFGDLAALQLHRQIGRAHV